MSYLYTGAYCVEELAGFQRFQSVPGAGCDNGRVRGDHEPNEPCQISEERRHVDETGY